MSLARLLLIVLLGLALALPTAGAISIEVDASSWRTVPVDLDSHAGAQASVGASPGLGVDGQVRVHADPDIEVGAHAAAGDGGVPGHAPVADPAVTPQSAAIGTALGAMALLAVWALLKYGAMLGVGAPLFSRIASHRVLDNDVRSRVHECIVATPGVTIKEVTTLLGIGWGTAVYHLERLEDERLVVSKRNRQFRRYFKNGGDIANGDRAAFAELRNPVTERLASEIVNQPGTGQQALCAAVGISAPRAHKHLAWLEEADLLTKERKWRAVKYFPTEKLLGFLVPSPVVAAA